MKKIAQKKYLIATIIVLMLIGALVCFVSGGYGIYIVNKIAKVFDMNVLISILAILVLALFIFKLFSNTHEWEKLLLDTKKELVKTVSELADVSEELEALKIKLSKIKKLHPEIDFEAEIAEE